jgi:hypothetical protein
MAILIPSNYPSLRTDAGLYRELEVLDRLQHSLPDTYEIFHSVEWHSIDKGSDRHGEIDLVILSPSGTILLMEVKAGEVVLRNGDLFKLYSSRERERNVGQQCRVQYAAMVNRLQEAGLRAQVTNCLVLPDYLIGDAHVVAIPRERIIDAGDYDRLGTRVQDILSGGQIQADRDALRHFLKSEFRVLTDLSVLRDQIQGVTHQLADGLATWVPRIKAPSGVIRIQATAGSGKTQLALRLLEDAIAKSQYALYVCYNRSLADHIIAIAPPRACVSSFHELCVDHYRRTQGEPDFTSSAIFERITAAYLADSASFSPRFDLVVVDEAQDIEPGWMGSLLPQLKDDGRLYVLEDDDQRLYERDGFDLSEAVTLTCRDNYRSPQSICQVINAFSLAERSVVSCNPYRGEFPGFHRYGAGKDVIRVTASVVEELLSRGFGIADIVVLTGHGRSKSVLLNAEQIGPHKTRRFTAAFSKNSDPIWTEGELLVESIFRFKGQSAPAVILSEVDFNELSPLDKRKLFVGMTRAQMAVEIVISSGAEAVFSMLLAS